MLAVAHRERGDCYIDPDRWMETASQHDGSWWPEWLGWLERISSGARIPARQPPPGLGPAPGNYVLER